MQFNDFNILEWQKDHAVLETIFEEFLNVWLQVVFNKEIMTGVIRY